MIHQTSELKVVDRMSAVASCLVEPVLQVVSWQKQAVCAVFGIMFSVQDSVNWKYWFYSA